VRALGAAEVRLMAKRRKRAGKRVSPGKPAEVPAQKAREKPSASKEKKTRKYPMPCPKCHKVIDATDHLCPYCGVDTDAMLWPARAVFPFVVLGLMWVVGALVGRIPPAWAFGLIAGTIAAGIVVYIQRKRSQ